MVCPIYIYMMYEDFLLERYHKTHEISSFPLYVFFANNFQFLFLNLTVNPFSAHLLGGVVGMKDMFFSFPFINGGAFCCSAFSTKAPSVAFDILLKAIVIFETQKMLASVGGLLTDTDKS